MSEAYMSHGLFNTQETTEEVERERLRPHSVHTPAGFMRRVFRIPAGQEKNMELTKDQLPKLAELAEIRDTKESSEQNVISLNLSPDGKHLIGT